MSHTIGSIIVTVLWIYLILLIARFVIDLLQALSRKWQPTGVMLVICEAIFTVTDPPLKALRKVIPPLRLGQVALDLSFLVLLIVLQVAIALASRL